MPAPKKYPDELRERGVRLALESDRPIAQVAKDLGIQRESLRRWVRQAEADEGKRNDLLTSDERERLKELERENRELRRANEILKAASVFFAAELDPQPPKMSAFIDEHRGVLRGRADLQRLGSVAPSDVLRGAQRGRALRARTLRDERLLGRDRRVHAANSRPYGARKVWWQLRREACTVAALHGRAADAPGRVAGRHAPRQALAHHDPDPTRADARDLVERDFTADAPEPPVGGGLHLRARPGPGVVYVAFVIDAFSAAGSSAGRPTPTCAPASCSTRCEMALWTRCARRRRRAGLITPTRGSQYTSYRLHPGARRPRRPRLPRARSATPMTMPSPSHFVDSFKTELIAERTWRSVARPSSRSSSG